METALQASVFLFVLVISTDSWPQGRHLQDTNKDYRSSLWPIQGRANPISNKPEHIIVRDIAAASSNVGTLWVQSSEDLSQPLIMDSKRTSESINRHTNPNERQEKRHYSQIEHSPGSIRWGSDGILNQRVGDRISMPHGHHQVATTHRSTSVNIEIPADVHAITSASKIHHKSPQQTSQHRVIPLHTQQNVSDVQHNIPDVSHTVGTHSQRSTVAALQDIVQTYRNATNSHTTHGKEQTTVKDSNSTKPEGNSSGESPIIFPGNSGNSVVKFVPEEGKKPPTCSKGQTFCPTIDTYPKDYLNALLKNEVQKHEGVFGSDVILDKPNHFKPLQGSPSNNTKVKIPRRFKKIRNDVSTRMGPEEVALCVSVEDVVYPKTAQNKDGQWLFVVNHDQYIQGVRVEKCAKEGRCTLTDGFPLGYTTSCKQKYIYRKLLALGEDGQTVSDSFRLPSCCSCIVTKPVGASEINRSQVKHIQQSLQRGNHRILLGFLKRNLYLAVPLGRCIFPKMSLT